LKEEVEESEKARRLRLKREAKKEEYELVKTENGYIKRELVKREGVKNEDVKNKSNYMYVLDDDDDDCAFVGKGIRKIKFEEDDIKGTVLEGIDDYEKVNINQDGDVVEMKEFKPWNPAIK